MKILVVAAWEPELAPIRTQCAARLGSVTPFGDPLDIVFEPLGVGLVEAAIGASRALARHAPTLALFVGTCGAFVGAEALPDTPEVVTGRAACLVDAAVVAAKAGIPGPMPIATNFDDAFVEAARSVGARSVQIANTVGVTVDDTLASEFARHGDVEHLEAFAFARACAAHGVPCGAVLGVANAVGSRGREQWMARHVAASERAADVAAPAIEAYVRTSTRARSPERA